MSHIQASVLHCHGADTHIVVQFATKASDAADQRALFTQLAMSVDDWDALADQIKERVAQILAARAHIIAESGD